MTNGAVIVRTLLLVPSNALARNHLLTSTLTLTSFSPMLVVKYAPSLPANEVTWMVKALEQKGGRRGDKGEVEWGDELKKTKKAFEKFAAKRTRAGGRFPEQSVRNAGRIARGADSIV